MSPHNLYLVDQTSLECSFLDVFWLNSCHLQKICFLNPSRSELRPLILFNLQSTICKGFRNPPKGRKFVLPVEVLEFSDKQKKKHLQRPTSLEIAR